MKYHVEVNTYSCAPGIWTGNNVDHDTLDAAIAAALDLFGRWTAVKYWQVVDDNGQLWDTNEDPRTEAQKAGWTAL